MNDKTAPLSTVSVDPLVMRRLENKRFQQTITGAKMIANALGICIDEVFEAIADHKNITPDEAYNLIISAKYQKTVSGRPMCQWTADDDGIYETECGNMFEITEGSPVENGMVHCCYCGGVLTGA